jgi:catechol 2,3-dioxygenase-like lactoylglutathione lyase family enzyme
MSLHRLTDITLGVPDIAQSAEFYTEFGLLPQSPTAPDEHWFGTVDGGPRPRPGKPDRGRAADHQ